MTRQQLTVFDALEQPQPAPSEANCLHMICSRCIPTQPCQPGCTICGTSRHPLSAPAARAHVLLAEHHELVDTLEAAQRVLLA